MMQSVVLKKHQKYPKKNTKKKQLQTIMIHSVESDKHRRQHAIHDANHGEVHLAHAAHNEPHKHHNALCGNNSTKINN